MIRTIREARTTDMADIMQVMEEAKAIMRQSGNIHHNGLLAIRRRRSLHLIWRNMEAL